MVVTLLFMTLVVVVIFMHVTSSHKPTNRRPHHFNDVTTRKPTTQKGQRHCVCVSNDVITHSFRFGGVAQQCEGKTLEILWFTQTLLIVVHEKGRVQTLKLLGEV